MNTMLKSAKVAFVVLALAAMLVLSSGIAPNGYRAAGHEENEKTINSTTPANYGAGITAVNPKAPCSPPVSCSTTDPAFSAINTGSGHGLYASSMGSGLYSGIVGDNLNPSDGGYGVSGYSFGFAGVFGYGKSPKSNGVYGNVNNGEGSGVHGRNDGENPLASWGVFGYSPKGFAGVFGAGGNNGVFGQTGNGNAAGVHGRNDGDNKLASWGVFGYSPKGFAGVFGAGANNGVFGQTNNGNAAGVYGTNDGGGAGVLGTSKGGDGISGRSFAANKSGVFGYTDNKDGVGGSFTNSAGGVALVVDGRAKVKVLEITGADLSERFEVKSVMASGREASQEQIRPGLVVSIDPQSPGRLVISRQAYDHRVAGIISGAGGIRTGVLMNQPNSLADGSHPVALTGRVYCWVDASFGSIEPGDLLTTSATPGHAMKVTSRNKANGAIIGKAMTGLKEGRGLVLVLVTLQ